MREILFRGKRTDNGEWAEGYYACESNHACFAYELKYHHYIFKDVFLDWNLGGLEKYEVIPETVGQYTGLCDKNGKKIFEGDVVKHYCSSIDKNKFDIGDIYYSARCCQFRRTSATHGEFYTINDECEYEIIGNIHDNPELLRKEDEGK